MNRFKRGDTVIIVAGKDRGKTGKILAVFPSEEEISVEKVSVRKKHTKPTQKAQGGIFDMVGKISWSNAKIVCPKTGKPTRVVFELVGGKKVRKAVVSGEILDY